MEYKKIKPQNLSEAELRKIWSEEYCQKEIYTFDNVRVLFFDEMFDHVFFESSNRFMKDKEILTLNRLEKIHWIHDTLKDPDAILKKGWDAKKKEFYKDRRVAIVKGNYVVIIRFIGHLRAKLVTAYEKNDIENILNNPDFVKDEKYFGKEKT